MSTRDEQPQVVITVSKATRDLLRAQVVPGTRMVGELWRHDGRVDLLVDAEVFAHLEAISTDMDLAIAQVCARQFGRA